MKRVSGSTWTILFSIFLLVILLGASYVLSIIYPIGFFTEATLFFFAVVTTVVAIYECIQPYFQDDSDGQTNTTDNNGKDDQQITKPSKRNPETPENTFSSEESMDVGRDIRIGEQTEIGEVHLHRDSKSVTQEPETNGDYNADSGPSKNSSTLEMSDTDTITEAITGGSLNEIYFTPVKSEFGLTPITFRTPLFAGYDVHSFTDQSSGGLSFSQFKKSLSKVVPSLRGIDTAAFAISQETGQWYGYGLPNFIEALSKPTARYDRDYSGKRHGNEAAVCLLGVENGGIMAIGCQPITPSGKNRLNPTRSLSIGFLTSGTPVDTQKYQKIAHSFDVKLKQGITESEAYVAQMTANTQTNPLDFISIDRRTLNSTEWADYAIIRNPFDQYPRLKQELEFSYESGKSLDEQYWNRPRELVAACKYVPINITAGMTPEARSKNIMVHDINVSVHTGLTVGHGHCNLEISGIDVEG